MSPAISYGDAFAPIFPPRPTLAINPKHLPEYDDGTYLAECKMNGDAAVIYTNGTETFVRDRHKRIFRKDTRILDSLAKTLHRGNGWLVVAGEYMNKAAKDSSGKNFNGNLALWDLMVLGGINCTSYSHEARKQLLDDLYAVDDHSEPFLLATENPRVQVVKHYLGNFESIYDSILKVPMVEGLVLKKRKSLLPLGLSEDAAGKGMFKFRKPTENYHY